MRAHFLFAVLGVLLGVVAESASADTVDIHNTGSRTWTYSSRTLMIDYTATASFNVTTGGTTLGGVSGGAGSFDLNVLFGAGTTSGTATLGTAGATSFGFEETALGTTSLTVAIGTVGSWLRVGTTTFLHMPTYSLNGGATQTDGLSLQLNNFNPGATDFSGLCNTNFDAVAPAAVPLPSVLLTSATLLSGLGFFHLHRNRRRLA
jgi:hypothetical protein